MTLVVLDLKIANVGSVVNMVRRIGAEVTASADPHVVGQATKIIFPGVGSYDHGVQELHSSGLFEALSRRVLVDKVPILGICLGMQLFTRRSEEGQLDGLGWVDADVRRFKPQNSTIKVPHMGWDYVALGKSSPLFYDMSDDARFYFVHSYYVTCADESDVIARTHYDIDFVSAFQKDNICGVQFHPEKSHRYGKQILQNFIERVA